MKIVEGWRRIDNQRDNVGMNSNFDPKQAWARRGDSWQGRKEEEHAIVFPKDF
jgi:hypothetical protein